MVLTSTGLRRPQQPDPRELRLAAVRTEMHARGVAGLLVVSPENVYYLLGLDYQGHFAFNALFVPGSGAPVLLTRAMEAPTVRAQQVPCRHQPFHDGEDPVPVIASVIREHLAPGEVLGVEDSSMFFPPRVHAALGRELGEMRMRDTSTLVSALREVKAAEEIEAMRAAAALSDRAVGAGIAAVRTGVREHEVAAAVYQAMLTGGGHHPGFAPLIRATSRLDQEHTSWSERPITEGEGLFLELSACVRRYHAPLARTVFVGSATPEAVAAHAAAQAGMQAILASLRPGERASSVFAAWEAAVEAVHPQPSPPRHHCGYLVGIGFPPSWVGGGEVLGIRPDTDRLLLPGMTFHAMSWVSEPVGYVVSDTVLVTEEGNERLTRVPHDLTVVCRGEGEG